MSNDNVIKPQYEGQKNINFREVSPPSSVRELTDEGGDTSLKLIYSRSTNCLFNLISYNRMSKKIYFVI